MMVVLRADHFQAWDIYIYICIYIGGYVNVFGESLKYFWHIFSTMFENIINGVNNLVSVIGRSLLH